MRSTTRLVTVLVLALVTARPLVGQITSNPIPAPIEKRGLAVEIKDLVRLPDTRGLRPARSGRVARRLGARQLRARPSGRPPLRQRLARLPVSARRQQPASRLRERRRRLSRCRVQPARERVHRLHLSPRVRAERICSTRCTPSAGRAIPKTAELHPARICTGRRDVPQRHHRVARDEPGGEHVRGHAARAAPRSARRR